MLYGTRCACCFARVARQSDCVFVCDLLCDVVWSVFVALLSLGLCVVCPLFDANVWFVFYSLCDGVWLGVVMVWCLCVVVCVVWSVFVVVLVLGLCAVRVRCLMRLCGLCLIHCVLLSGLGL